MVIDSRRILGIVVAMLMATGCAAPSKVRQSNSETPPVAPPTQHTNTAASSVVASLGLATSQAQPNDPASFKLAMRFIKSWNAGKFMRAGMEEAMNNMRADQPGLAELARRVLADIRTEELEDILARAYARHMSVENLTYLLGFTETPTGKRFLDLAMSVAFTGKPVDETIMREFNADELALIMKFGQSEQFERMQGALPAINKEMAEESRALGERKMREYLQRH